MATTMTKGTAGMKTAGPANSYLKKGGTTKMKKGGMKAYEKSAADMKSDKAIATKMGYMKKGGTKKGM